MPPWVVSLLVAFGALTVAMQLYLPVPLLAALMQQFGISAVSAGLVSSVFGIAHAAGFMVFGPLSDRFGRRPILGSGLIVLAVITVAVALADSFEALITLRAVQGFVAGSFPPVALAYLAEALPERDRRLGVGLMSSAFLLAGAAGQIYAQWLGELGLAGAMWPLVVLYLLLAVVMRRMPADHGPRPQIRLAHMYAALPKVLFDARLLRIYSAAFVVLGSFIAFYVALDQSLGVVLRAAGYDPLLVRVVALPMTLLPLLAPALLKRLGSPLMLIMGLMLAAASLTALSATPHVVVLLGLSAFFVAGVSIAIPAMINGVREQAEGARRGMALSLYSFILFIGASLGPVFATTLGPAHFTAICLALAAALALAAVANLRQVSLQK